MEMMKLVRQRPPESSHRRVEFYRSFIKRGATFQTMDVYNVTYVI